jgi:hypothetical protein
MKSMTVTLFCVLFASTAFAKGMENAATKFVPNGKVVQEGRNEMKVRTANNTVVELAFADNGQIKEASGDRVDKDAFMPGMKGFLSLEQARESAKGAGKSPIGEWSFGKDPKLGWHYGFAGFENGKAMDYRVDGKSGKLLSAKAD